MTKNDDFVGSTFPTPKGGILTVVSISDKKNGTTKRYRLECDICHKDSELFPNLFESLKGNLNEGKIPCGCGNATRWTKYQYNTRIKRECIKRGYVFHGFVSEWKANRTKLRLSCLKDNNAWKTTSIADFLCMGSGCPECQKDTIREAVTLDDKVMITSFLASGSFPIDATFTRNKVRKSKSGQYPYWDYICKKCSFDVYSKNGLCTGIFTSTAGDLQRGILSCRCSSKYRWNKEQREYKIKSVCKNEDLRFGGWVGKYKGNTSKFNWICSKGHKCKTRVGHFLNGDTRCRSCFYESNDFGYFPERAEENDNLYLLKFIGIGLYGLLEIFYKIGRTFNINKRISYFPKYFDIELIASVQMPHKEVYDTEQEYHRIAREHHYLPKIKFGGSKLECFNPSVLDIINIHAE